MKWLRKVWAWLFGERCRYCGGKGYVRRYDGLAYVELVPCPRCGEASNGRSRD